MTDTDKPVVTVTEDDRRRANLAVCGGCMPGPHHVHIRDKVALALAETRERAEERYAREIHTPNARKWIDHDTQQRARIAELGAENKRLDAGWKECQRQGRRLRDRLEAANDELREPRGMSWKEATS